MKSINSINRKLAEGKAVVMTASELIKTYRQKGRVSVRDVDVVTAATCGLMSGTYVSLSYPACRPNAFTKARKVFFNGVESYPGPCPNERIGLIDTILYVNKTSRDNPRYGGGHVIQDLAAGRKVAFEIVTDEGKRITGNVSLKDMPNAVLYGTRHAFKNYVGFVNPGTRAVRTIFCTGRLPPHLKGATIPGCGEINPLQKDPKLKTIGVGTRVMLNGGIGYVTGLGTRSSPERPNMAVFGDLHQMKPEYMGGFMTSYGQEAVQTWAVPIPIVSREVLDTVLVQDNEVPLVITDVRGREPLTEVTYADVWSGTAQRIGFGRNACRAFRHNCPDCPPEVNCPTGAFSLEKEKIDAKVCFHCGYCSVVCRGRCFRGNLGHVEVKGQKVPIIQRLSNRLTAEKAALELKMNILNNQFILTEPLEKIHLS